MWENQNKNSMQYIVYYKYYRHYEWKKIPITDNVIAS